ILDEPIQGLDPVQIVEMRNMIGELRGEHTILLSTHILTEIEATCDRILVLHQGRIAAQGTENELAAKLLSGSTLELEVRGTADALRAALAPLSSVRKLQVTPLRDDVVRGVIQVDDAAREQVSRAVVEAGLGLLAMHAQSTGLEAVFLQLSAANAAGGAAPTSVRPPVQEASA
ncbi:MAG: ABC transporter ATP-binding protein, partial [Polyangiales bacterium]